MFNTPLKLVKKLAKSEILHEWSEATACEGPKDSTPATRSPKAGERNFTSHGCSRATGSSVTISSASGSVCPSETDLRSESWGGADHQREPRQ